MRRTLGGTDQCRLHAHSTRSTPTSALPHYCRRVLRFRVLGPFEVEDERGPLTLGSPRRRALLALLTLNADRVVAVDRLVDALWEESPPRTAVHVLHVYVSDLRHALPDGVLMTAPPGYRLRIPAGAVDLADFEHLVSQGRTALSAGDSAGAARSLDEALALWRGPMLQDLADEGFVQIEARRLEELRLAARELQAQAALARGGDPELVPQLTALINEHPYRERPHALLMRALAAAGRQAEALEVFATIRARLADELGIEPGAELRTAQTAVLRQEAAPTHAAAPTGAVLAVGCDPRRLQALTLAASRAAAAAGRELLTAAVLDARTTVPADLTAAAAAARDAQRSTRGPGRSAAFRSRNLADHVAALAAEHDADLVVLDAAGLIGAQGRLADWLVAALSDLTADVALLPNDPPTTGIGFAVPFGGTEHDWAAAEHAALLARAAGSTLRVVGAIAEHDDASRLVARVGLAIQRAVGITVEPILADATLSGLLTALAGTTAVIGVSERWRSEGLGPFRQQLAAATHGTLIIRRGLRPGLLAPPTSGTRFAWSAAG
jgi:DNA-binding SARP family transcriptional activator